MKRSSRNFRQHASNRRHSIAVGNTPDGFCSRCVNIWCVYNITPGNRLPTASDAVGRTRQCHCSLYEKDYELPDLL